MSTSIFFRRGVLEQIGYLDETLHYLLDWEYWVRFLMAGLKMRHIRGRVLTLAREHSESKTIQIKERFYQERVRVLESIFNSPDTPDAVKKLEKRAYSGIFASGAYFYWRNGQIGKGFVALSEAVRRCLACC